MPTADASSDPPPLEAARDELQTAVPEAAKTLTTLLDADDERVQIRAAEAILDRAGLAEAATQSPKEAQVQIGGGEGGTGVLSADPLAEEQEPF